MANWDIDHGTCGKVIGKAGTQAAGYKTDLTTLSTAFENAPTNLKASPLVLQRLGEFSDKRVQPAVNKITGHTHSALQGTTDAIGYYQLGDLKMATTAQRNAAKATYPTPPGAKNSGGPTVSAPDGGQG